MQIIIDFNSKADLKRKLDDLLGQMPINEHIIENPSKKPAYSNKRWTQYEIDNVRDWYLNKTFTAKEMAKSLQRTPQSVSQLIFKLTQKGLPKRKPRAGKVMITSQ